MKLVYIFLLLIVGLTVGQDNSLPSCAGTCIVSAIAKTGCSSADLACFCSGDGLVKLKAALTPCLISSCSASDLVKAETSFNSTCAGAVGSPGSGSSSSIVSRSTIQSSSSSQAPATSSSSSSSSSSPTAVSQTTSPSPSTSDATSSRISSPNTETNSPSPTPTPASGGSGLSAGAIAGIVVGILAVIGLLLGAFLFYRRRRQPPKSAPGGGNIPMEEGKGFGQIVPGHNELAGASTIVPTNTDDKAFRAIKEDKDKPVEIGSVDRGPGELEGEVAHEIDSNGRQNLQPVEAEAAMPAEIDSHPREQLSALELPGNIPAVMPEPSRTTPHTETQSMQETESHSNVAATGSDGQHTSELEELRRKEAELEKERQYVQRIQEIEAEKAHLQQRMAELNK